MGNDEFIASLKLNENQEQATVTESKYTLCIAGAGTGKTKTLTSRIGYLNKIKNVNMENILSLTFTRLAGSEMKERIIKLSGEETGRKLFCNTFHAFCVEVLKEFGHKIDLEKNFAIYEDKQREPLLKKFMDELGGKGKTNLTRVTNLFKLNHSIDEKIQFPQECRVVNEYKYYLRQNNAVDLQWLIDQVNDLWSKYPDVLEVYRNRYEYVFVDEFQDTSTEQMEMLRLLNPRNLFVVGDDAQAIYGWRNAKIEYILNFDKTYSGCEVIKLERNYRCTIPIIEAANNLIGYNTKQIAKTLYTTKEGSPIVYNTFPNEFVEADFVVQKIQEYMAQKKVSSYAEIAILARTNFQLELVRKRLSEVGIPIQESISGINPFKKNEVVPLFTWLDAVYNKRDNAVLKDILSEYLTDFQLQQLEFTALEEDLTLYYALEQNYSKPSFTSLKAVYEKLKKLEKLVVSSAGCDALKAIEIADECLGISKMYKEKGYHQSVKAIEELKNDVENWTFMQESLGEPCDYSSFSQWVKYQGVQEVHVDEKEDAVNMLTVHGSKGLEYEMVFLIGMNQDIFPSKRSDIEEERRIAYVGVTRAKDHLLVSSTLMMSGWGGKLIESTPSQFIQEMKTSSSSQNTAPSLEDEMPF